MGLEQCENLRATYMADRRLGTFLFLHAITILALVLISSFGHILQFKLASQSKLQLDYLQLSSQLQHCSSQLDQLVRKQLLATFEGIQTSYQLATFEGSVRCSYYEGSYLRTKIVVYLRRIQKWKQKTSVLLYTQGPTCTLTCRATRTTEINIYQILLRKY